jgi:tetratricopeptide (TPR) repeat protein
MKKDFYISHASADAQWAEWIAGTLEENGYSVFLWSWDIKAGDNWHNKIGDALQNCERFICVLSPRFLNSKFATDELNEASTSGKRILPIRIEDFHVSGLLETIVYIDFVGKNEKTATETLLNAVGECEPARKKIKFPSYKSSLTETGFPKTLSINNLPSRNNYLTGRNEQLERIENALKKNDAISIIQTISGLGGIGKTQLAIEYAYRYCGNYTECIWFVVAESRTTVYNYFKDFAEYFKLILPPEFEPGELQRAVREWLSENSYWLLIFDNLESIDTVKPYLPQKINGRIIITSRSTRVNYGETLELGVFDFDESIKFLKRRFSENDEMKIEEYAFDDFEEYAPKLTERLGHLPLALEQAAAYIKKMGCRISDYLKMLAESSVDAFTDEDAKAIYYESIVNNTWEISFEALSTSAQYVMNLCAYMAPDKIPVEFLVEMRNEFPMPLKEALSKALSTNRIVSELRACSLVSGNADFINIHCLTQEIIRQSHNNDMRWLDCCFIAIKKSLPHDLSTSKARTWFACIALHSETVLQHINYQYTEDVTIQESIADLYNCIGFGYNDIAYYPQALMAYNKAHSICEKVWGQEHPKTAAIYNNIAFVYSNQGDYAAALEWYYKALTIREKVLGEKHPDTAITYNNIAEVYNNQGDYQKALEWYQRALIICEMALGKKHLDTAIIYNNIAKVYNSQGDCPRALEWSFKAINIRENILGKEHPDVAATYNNIALVHFCQGDYAVALEWYFKALAIYEKVLGKDHPDTAKIYSNIAAVYDHTGEGNKSLAYYANALRIYFNILGESYPSVQVISENARKTFTSIDRPESFEQWLQEAFVHGGDLQ